jgi:hypothetical protein
MRILKRIICLFRGHDWKDAGYSTDYVGPSLEAVYTPRKRCKRCDKWVELPVGTGSTYWN